MTKSNLLRPQTEAPERLKVSKGNLIAGLGDTAYVREDVARDELQAAVAAARREERERCARIAEEHGRAIYRANKNSHPEIAAEALADGDDIAAAIRAETHKEELK